MMTPFLKITCAAATLLLCACGKVGPLEPRIGSAAPVKAYGADTVPDTDALLQPAMQTRPGRSDELMRRSERRNDDPFDLPPGSDTTETSPLAETAEPDPAPLKD